MKYLLLVHFYNSTESYYSDNPDKLKAYAELKKFQCWEVYELNGTVYSYIESDK